MSRPSITTPPSRPSARWRATSTARTRGRRATRAADWSMSGVRMARVTSWPSIVTIPASCPKHRALGQRRQGGLVVEGQAFL